MASSNVRQQPHFLSTVNVANFVSTKLYFNDTSNNYVAWKEQMLCLIGSQGLLGFIDGTNEPTPETAADGTTSENDLWRRTDMLLKGWILCSLNDDVIYAVLGLKTSRDVWLELEDIFRRISDSDPPNYGPDPAPKGDLKEYVPLHRAALRGNWEAAKRILDRNPGAMAASIDVNESTALHIAVGTGKAVHFVKKLVAAMPEELLAVTDDVGDTALIIAAAVGNRAAATILVSKKPDLLYIPNDLGCFPVQIAAVYAQRDMLQYMISVTRDDLGVNPYAGRAGLTLLHLVIEADYFDIALDLVKKYPDLARINPPDDRSALEKISAKKSVFVSERRFNFWERFIASCESCLNS
ncbi:hypothetical protein Salat_1043400 [Sesamum alatum]|uniref:Uncharacterized protein n=1 Tax=Sesamum alatum TaxID=300844 RepID=A0AAE2CSF5_9LAMI|nr:hypothetical protein Salat_1043400 [Sesamum alatum]